MLFIEDLLRADPTFDHDAFYNPMTLALSWISEELRLYQLDFKYCHDPERRPIVPVYDALEDLEEFQEGGIDDEEEDEDEDLFVILVLSVFSDDPESFRARPTQPQLDLLTSLLGSQPQWWVGYKGWC